MLQTACAYIHTLIRMPAIYAHHIPVPPHIYPLHHISAPVSLFTTFLLDFPVLSFFHLYALSCTLYGYSCIMPIHCQILCSRHMRSISKHPVSRLQREFKTKQKDSINLSSKKYISLQRMQKDIKKS